MPNTSGGMGRNSSGPNPAPKYSKNSNKANTVSAINPRKKKKKK